MCESDLLKALKDPEEEYVWGQNVLSEELDDSSFIQFWEDNTHYEVDLPYFKNVKVSIKPDASWYIYAHKDEEFFVI